MYTAHIVWHDKRFREGRTDTLHRTAEVALRQLARVCTRKCPLFMSVVPYPPRGDKPALLYWVDFNYSYSHNYDTRFHRHQCQRWGEKP